MVEQAAADVRNAPPADSAREEKLAAARVGRIVRVRIRGGAATVAGNVTGEVAARVAVVERAVAILGAHAALPRVERFDRRGTEPFEPFRTIRTIRILSK